MTEVDTEERIDNSMKYEEFSDFFEGLSGPQKVCIVGHPTPDPDSIGSALGLSFLLESLYGIESDLFYCGAISHPQNLTTLNILDIRMKTPDDFDPEKYSIYITVDTTPQNTGEMGSLVDDWDMVFDHHQTEAVAELVDIRKTGSCSSIIWDYLRYFNVDFNSEKGVIAATALLFGLENDTGGLLKDSTSDLDIEAHSGLIRYIDRKKFHNIVNYPLPPYLFELKALAANNMVNKDSILISYLGIMSEKRRDTLPTIADEFLRMEGVETVVVFCTIDNHIHASIRSQNSSVNVPQFCERVFGSEYAGGKMGAGAARVPIGFLHSSEDDSELRRELSELAQDIITKRIVKHLSGA